MRNLKYFFQFILIIFSFSIFKIIGIKNASSLSGKIFEIIEHILDQRKQLIQTLKKHFQILKMKI